MKKIFRKKREIFKDKLNYYSLSFSRRETEKEFLEHYTTKHLWQLRIAHILAILLFLLASLTDYFMLGLPNGSIKYNLLIVIPVFIIGYTLTFIAKSFYKKHYKIFNIVYVSITSLAFLFSGIMAPEGYKHYLFTGILICMIFNYTFIKQDYIKASITGLVILILFFIVTMHEKNHGYFINHLTIYLIAVNILGVFIAYSIEFEGRSNYLFLQQIESDKFHIKKINKSLEKLVSKRTSELEKRNKELSIYQNNLENLIEKRTLELEEKNKELLKFNKIFIGREFRIKELKDSLREMQGILEKHRNI